MSVSNREIIKLVEGCLKLPYPRICRHQVALDLLDVLERSGEYISPVLAKAICDAEDNKALDILSREGPKIEAGFRHL